MKKNIIIAILTIITISLAIKLNNIYKQSDDNKINKKEEVNVNNTSNKELNDDNKVIEYIDKLDNEVENIIEKEDITEKDEIELKDIFIKFTDFIFYGDEINGKTFNDLTNNEKEKVINIYEKIDEKIESRFPNYKENIKDKGIKTYNNIKEKIKELKESLLSEYKTSVGEENYDIVVDSYEDGKENIKEVYNEYKPVIEEGKEKSKDIISKAKEKLSNWYKEYKEG